MDMDGPALTPPAGVTSDFDNPPNNNPLAVGVLSTCAAVATLCIIIRVYARVVLLRKVQIEEGMYSGHSGHGHLQNNHHWRSLDDD
jgi:hypothetical protein